MKRPVSLLLLLVFAAVQIYFAKVPLSHQVQGSSWIEVSPHAGGVVERQNQYYLVTPKMAYRLSANSVHITAKATSMNWMDVPEPSGQGVWHLALGPADLPLLGIGGPVYPAPDGQSVLWVDPSTHLVYRGGLGNDSLNRWSERLGSVTKILWAPDSQAVAVAGQGPNGYGVYAWDRDNNVSPVAIPNQALTVTGLGFSRRETVLASFSNGQVLWQGHGVVKLPPLNPVALAPTHAELIGMTANHVILWRAGKRREYSRPDLKWTGKPRFSADGQYTATLARTMGGDPRLLIYSSHHQWDISLPFGGHTHFQLLGFMGNHWALVTVPDGPHQGTYAWWVATK